MTQLTLLYSNCIPIITYTCKVKQFSFTEMSDCNVAVNNALRCFVFVSIDGKVFVLCVKCLVFHHNISYSKKRGSGFCHHVRSISILLSDSWFPLLYSWLSDVVFFLAILCYEINERISGSEEPEAAPNYNLLHTPACDVIDCLLSCYDRKQQITTLGDHMPLL